MTPPSQFSAIQNTILEIVPNDAMMRAVMAGEFYVVATPSLSGWYIGTMEKDGAVAPALLPIEACAVDEYMDYAATMQQAIKDGYLSSDISLPRFLFTAKWDGHSDTMRLLDEEGQFVVEQCWRSLSGMDWEAVA